MTKDFVCLTLLLRNHTSYDCGFWYRCEKDDISSNFFCFFKIVIFWVFRWGGGKRVRMTNNYQFQSVTLYITRTVDHIIKIFGTQLCFSLFFFENTTFYVLTFLHFYWPISTVFLTNSCFSSSSINAKQKF